MRKRLAISLVANSRFLPESLWNFFTAMIWPLVASNTHDTVPYEPAPTSPPRTYFFDRELRGPMVYGSSLGKRYMPSDCHCISNWYHWSLPKAMRELMPRATRTDLALGRNLTVKQWL